MEPKKENPFISLAANIALPVFILNKTEVFPGEHKALWALGTALLFPLCYGLWDLFQNSRTNYFSILGVINTAFTGVFALFSLDGFWFAVKEAALPACLGLGVYVSSLKQKPFIKKMLTASGLFQTELIQERAEELKTLDKIEDSYLKANSLFSISFLISAILNFALALYIFRPIDTQLPESEKAVLLNGQISQMTWAGIVVISIPMVFFLGFTFYRLMHSLQKHTGLSQDELFKA